MLAEVLDAHIYELSYIAHVLNKWDLLCSPLATELVSRAFHELAGTGHDFLTAVSAFEARHGVELRDKSTPPHVYFEPIMTMRNDPVYAGIRNDVEALLEVDRQKAVVTVGIIERFEDFFEGHGLGDAFKDASRETCEKEVLRHALRITGSIVRQVINHLMDTHHAEINFNKNPWIRSGIARRATAAIPACHHRRFA